MSRKLCSKDFQKEIYLDYLASEESKAQIFFEEGAIALRRAGYHARVWSYMEGQIIQLETGWTDQKEKPCVMAHLVWDLDVLEIIATATVDSNLDYFRANQKFGKSLSLAGVYEFVAWYLRTDKSWKEKYNANS